MSKKEIRENMLRALATVPNEIFEEKNQQIFHRFTQWLSVHQIKTMAITISHHREIDTYRLIRYAWNHQIQVVVPKCRPKTREMDFYRLNDFRQLEDSFMGLKEPNEEKSELITNEMIDLVVVPGVCFDKNGYRIGYGGGYYDRFLQKYRGLTVSLCLDEQLIPNVSKDDHDIPVQTILTETKTIIVKETC